MLISLEFPLVVARNLLTCQHDLALADSEKNLGYHLSADGCRCIAESKHVERQVRSAVSKPDCAGAESCVRKRACMLAVLLSLHHRESVFSEARCSWLKQQLLQPCLSRSFAQRVPQYSPSVTLTAHVPQDGHTLQVSTRWSSLAYLLLARSEVIFPVL
ncbi:hypothetical protein KL941_002056 [Ogataea angusta]|nr:hypothetical protein KL941_002056 [Ogataea angusta]